MSFVQLHHSSLHFVYIKDKYRFDCILQSQIARIKYVVFGGSASRDKHLLEGIK